MSLRTTVDQTRSSFPYMMELDLLGVKSTDLGLSPEFQEVLQNARDGDLTSAEIFAPYTVTPTNTETVLRRIGAARPFSDTALAGRAFHTNNAQYGKASIYIDTDLLDQQEKFMDEISQAVGLHTSFLHHCIDVSNIYQTQIAEGSVGLSADHDRKNGAGKSTPYEAYHDMLVSKFDVNRLNIPLHQRRHFTLADLAYRSLALLAPISHGQSTTGSWTMSSDLYITSKGYTKGTMACPYGEMVDGDGNPRYVIQRPGDNNLAYFNNTEWINLNSVTSPQNHSVMVRIRDIYEVDPSVTDTQLSAYTSGSSDADWDKVKLAGVGLSKLPGSKARYLAGIGVFGLGPGLTRVIPFSAPLAQPRFFDSVGAMGEYSTFTTSNAVKRLWDQPTHVVVDILRQASLLLTPQFRALDIPVVHGFVTPARLTCSMPFSMVVDLCNMFSYHKMRFNPVKQLEANNGPYGVSTALHNAKWTLPPEGRGFAATSALLEPVFGELACPTGYGTLEVPIRNLLGLLPNRAFETYFTSHPSALEKRQRTVVLPTGRSSTSMSIASSASDADMEAHTMLLRSLPFGCWRVTTLMPLSDIRYEQQTPVTDISNVGFATFPLTDYPLDYQWYMFAQSTEQLLGPNFTVVGGGEIRESATVIKNSMVRSKKVKKGTKQHKMLVDRNTEVVPGSPLMHTINRSHPGIANGAGATDVLGEFIDPAGQAGFITDFERHYVSTSGAVRATITYIPEASITGTAPQRTGIEQTVDVIGTLTDSAKFDSSGVTVAHAADIATFAANLNTAFGSKDPLDATHFADDTAFTASCKSAADKWDVEAYEIEHMVFSCTDPALPGAWSGSIPVMLTNCTLQTEGAHVTAQNAGIVRYAWWDGTDGVEEYVYGTSTTPSTDVITVSPDIVTTILHKIGVGDLGGMPGQATQFTGSDLTAIEDGGDYLLPELNNIMIRLDLHLMDAAVAKYSNMRLYPRAISKDDRFRGLPYFGEPEPFLRGLVEDLQPSLVRLDHVSNSPFTTSNINEIRVGTEVYEQSGYQSAMRQIAQKLGDMYSMASPESIMNAQESMVKRGQM